MAIFTICTIEWPNSMQMVPVTESGSMPEVRDPGVLFSRFGPYFVAVARSYVREQAAAEDIVMDCFRSYLEKQDGLSIPAQKIPAYILTSVKNRCLNFLRDRRKHLLIQGDIHSTTLRITDARIATLEALEPDAIFAEEVAAIVRRELERMPDRMRNIFIASRYHDKTYREIASQFGINLNQVEFALSKVTKIFRTALKDYLPSVLLIDIAVAAFCR